MTIDNQAEVRTGSRWEETTFADSRNQIDLIAQAQGTVSQVMADVRVI